MTTKDLTPSDRATLRNLAGVWHNVPVALEETVTSRKDGSRKRWTCYGKTGGYYTRGGTPIDHPSAYARRGWSNMVYRTDSRVLRLETNRAWKMLRPGQWARLSATSPYNRD